MWNSYVMRLGERAHRAADLAARFSQSGLERVFLSPRVEIWAAPNLSVMPLAGERGVILGHVFDRSGAAIAALSSGHSWVVCQSRGERLTTDFWGDYIGVIDDPMRADVHIVRAPSTALPCYRIEHPEGIVLTSDVRLAQRLNLYHPQISREGLLRLLVAPNLRERTTALAEVVELMPGHRLTWGEAGSREERLWSPWSFAGRDAAIGDFGDAVGSLRAALLSSIAAQARRFDNVLVAVSGGLDSSIVASALKAANQPFSAMTLWTREAAGDERLYARQLSDFLRCPLVEREEMQSLADIACSAAAHLPRPCARFFGQSSDRQFMQLADELGATAYMHGGGGDNIFAYLHSATPVADAVRRRGVRAGWRTARDMAMVTGSAAWEVAGRGFRRALSRRRPGMMPIDTRFLHADCVDPEFTPDSDWLDAPSDILPGKEMHVARIHGIQNRIEGYFRERERPNIAPLLAQPIVEMCLRIPTDLWCAGGINRAVARCAFEGTMPAALIRRQSKGTPDSFAFALYDLHHRTVLSALLDGELGRMRLLDRTAVEQAAAQAQPDAATCNRLMTLFDAEMWVRSWSKDSGQAALAL